MDRTVYYARDLWDCIDFPEFGEEGKYTKVVKNESYQDRCDQVDRLLDQRLELELKNADLTRKIEELESKATMQAVIELTRKLEICKAGLKFYASVSHWSTDNPAFDMRDDCGDVARQALKDIEGEK